VFGKKGLVPGIPVKGLSMRVEVNSQSVSEVNDRSIRRESEL
jgi:hypothetical protein